MCSYKVKATNKKYKVYHCNISNKTDGDAEMLPGDLPYLCIKPHVQELHKSLRNYTNFMTVVV